MRMVTLDTRQIRDWPTFHDVVAKAFGFPEFYGRNMDAWIDCMTSLDSPEDGMPNVHAEPGGVLVLQLDHVADFMKRCRQQYDSLVECAAFVNWRRIDVGEPPVLILSYDSRACYEPPDVKPRD
jgi:hypothetical protein